VTPHQAERLGRSIAYRRKLCRELPELEAKLISYVESTGVEHVYLAGYRVSVDKDKDHLFLEKLVPPEWEQLKLQLEGKGDEMER